jgi:hypothetical protein
MYNLPKNASNSIIDKIMGNWNMQTLEMLTYVKNAKKWIINEIIRQGGEYISDETCLRLDRKINGIKTFLGIKNFYEITDNEIKDKSERKVNPPG